ncbi:hypothetical protein L249_5977, partial [Ophiocordyceps polyrhachis-furcata BCC 54312]
TRPEGLGGSRDAGPAVAGPRPPYVTEAVRGGYGTATPYSGYGRTGRTGPAAAAADPEGLFNHRLLRGGEDEGPALADLAAFLPTAGELTADSTLFFFDLRGRYGYGYGYKTTGTEIRIRIRNEISSRIRVRAGNSSHNSRRNSRYNNSRYDSRYNRNNGSIRTYLRPYRPYGRPTLAGSKDSPPTLRRHEARRPKIKDTIDWLEKHAFFCRKVGPGPDESIEHSYGTRPEGLGGSRDAGPAVAGPRPPYVTEAERHNNVGGGYGTATPYSGYGRTGRTGRTKEGT